MKKNIPNEWKKDMPEAQEDDLLQRALRQKFDEELRQKWKGQLAEMGFERQPQARVVKMRWRKMAAWAAAAVIVLLVSVWWLIKPVAQPESVQLAQQFFAEVASQAAQTRMGEGDADPIWQSAKDHYSQGQFGEAAREIEKMAKANPLNTDQHYLLAMCFLQTAPPDYDAALKQLEVARLASNPQQKDDNLETIEWVRALALLQKGDVKAANLQLEGIVKTKGWYADKAKQLIGAMK